MNTAIYEEVDGSVYIYDLDKTDPDDLAFGRVKPVAIVPQGFGVKQQMEIVNLIETALDKYEPAVYSEEQ